METQTHILLLAAAFLWIGCGCQSIHHSSSSTYCPSVQLPDKPISQMNEEELEKTAQAINWANQINRGYYPYDWPHERRLNIWLKKP